MPRREQSRCEVGLNTEQCVHPGTAEPGQFPAVKHRCYSCGQRACTSCSRVQTWVVVVGERITKRRRRICNDCVRHYQN